MCSVPPSYGQSLSLWLIIRIICFAYQPLIQNSLLCYISSPSSCMLALLLVTCLMENYQNTESHVEAQIPLIEFLPRRFPMTFLMLTCSLTCTANLCRIIT